MKKMSIKTSKNPSISFGETFSKAMQTTNFMLRNESVSVIEFRINSESAETTEISSEWSSVRVWTRINKTLTYVRVSDRLFALDM